MKKILLIGADINESLSPAIHNGAIEYLGLNGEYRYELMPVEPSNFDERIKEILSSPDVAGFNVTAPYKCKIINYLDETDVFVQKCGACNLVKNSGGRWHGKNTDGYGFIMPIVKMGFSAVSKKAVIFGAGGAARAIAAQLIANGIDSLFMFNRDRMRAEALKEFICASYGFEKEKFMIYSYLDLQNDKFSSIMSSADLIINATSAVLEEIRFPALISPELFNDHQIIYDLSYKTAANGKVKLCVKKAGAVYLDGREMLMYQALASFVQWVSKKPPVWLLRKIVCYGA